MTWTTSALNRLDPKRRERIGRLLEGSATEAERIWAAPWRLLDKPDPWQRKVTTQLVPRAENAHVLCSRGAGKSFSFAAAAYAEACVGGFSIIFSRSDDQALEVMRYVKGYHNDARLAEVVTDNKHTLEFANGGRILVRPYSSHTVIGKHGVTLLGIDEAARVSDEFFAVVTPMLTVSEMVTGIKPRMALMSTPYGKRGFFYEERIKQTKKWRKHCYPWQACPRIKPEMVEDYRATHGDLWYRQEYCCFPWDVTVTTIDGIKRICSIKPGDHVLSHANRHRRVLGVLKRVYDGPLINLTFYGGNEGLRCTPEHPIRTTSDGQNYSWKRAGDLKAGDRITFNRMYLGDGPRVLPEALVILLGWYITEGSVGKTCVSLSLSSQENTERNQIVMCCDLLKLQVKQYERGSVRNIQINSAWFRDLCLSLCGRGAANKCIPLHLLAGNELTMYQTILDGDGCRWRGEGARDQLATVSKTLAYQFRLLANQVGMTASVRRRFAAQEGEIMGRKVNLKEAWGVEARKPNRVKCKLSRHKTAVSAPLRSVTDEHFKGMVYNLEVEHDNSYTANGVVVHNCEFLDNEMTFFDVDAFEQSPTGNFKLEW